MHDIGHSEGFQQFEEGEPDSIEGPANTIPLEYISNHVVKTFKVVEKTLLLEKKGEKVGTIWMDSS